MVKNHQGLLVTVEVLFIMLSLRLIHLILGMIYPSVIYFVIITFSSITLNI
jgi:hypothetical protein